MIGAVYIEREVVGHPRAEEIARRFAKAPRIEIERYGEVFNRRAQSFRLQKKRPSVILAKKHQGHVLPAPEGYGIGGRHNYYFSHMLNCLYDCRYCFLQGMYRSANYVVFVNYEDFFDAIATESTEADEASWFFSGYDCDSLAFETVTGFVESALPRFRDLPRAHLELRTKSVQTKALEKSDALPNCVVAWSFTPQEVSAAVEPGVPTVERRLAAMRRLAERGWRLGLRFDPLIYTEDYRRQYRALFDAVFATIDAGSIHSVSLGPFRLPTGFFRRVERLYPDEPLLAGPFDDRGGMISYQRDLEREMIDFCLTELRREVAPECLFPCLPTED